MHKIYRTSNNGRSRQSFFWGIIVTVLLVGIAIVESRGLGFDVVNIDEPKRVESIKNDVFNVTPVAAKLDDNAKIHDNFLILDEWSDSLLDKEHIGTQWILRWDMQLSGSGMEKMAQQLFIDEFNHPLNKVINEDGTYISGVIPNYKGKLTIQRVFDELGNDLVVALLKVENDSEKSKELSNFVKHVDQTIQTFAKQISVSVKITGVMQDDALQRIKQVTHSSTVEEYKDNSMNVVTAYSTKLKKNYWRLNNKMVNLQYAFYFDKNTQDSILTLAIPLVSGEFGEILEKSWRD